MNIISGMPWSQASTYKWLEGATLSKCWQTTHLDVNRCHHCYKERNDDGGIQTCAVHAPSKHDSIGPVLYGTSPTGPVRYVYWASPGSVPAHDHAVPCGTVPVCKIVRAGTIILSRQLLKSSHPLASKLSSLDQWAKGVYIISMFV